MNREAVLEEVSVAAKNARDYCSLCAGSGSSKMLGVPCPRCIGLRTTLSALDRHDRKVSERGVK